MHDNARRVSEWNNLRPIPTPNQAVHTNEINLAKCCNKYPVGSLGDTELGLECCNRSLVLWVVVEWTAADHDNTPGRGSTGRKEKQLQWTNDDADQQFNGAEHVGV